MKVIGAVSPEVEKILNITGIVNRNIYIGESNILHMKSSHPADYEKYKAEIGNILSNPDYIGLNKKDSSIEYVKEFCIDNEFVKVAVRVSQSNRFYARSLYVLNNNRVKNFISKNTLKPIDKKLFYGIL